MTARHVFLAGLFTLACSNGALAAVSASEASKLGTSLTKFGAEAAASADGSIPAYTGGITAMTGLPTGSTPGHYIDPFASDRPLLKVTASNFSQYASQISAGVAELLHRFPNEFHLDVYPTHRTASYPAWVLKNTVANATRAELVGDGDGVKHAFGGIPFPIPQSGHEVMWNDLLGYHSASCRNRYQSYLRDASGAVILTGGLDDITAVPYYDPTASSLDGPYYEYYLLHQHEPPAEAGVNILFEFTTNFNNRDNSVFFYSPGTRRSRLAPESKYDTPIANAGGAQDYDEVTLFSGQQDKFDFKLVGKREMIVPYNDYGADDTTIQASIGLHTTNPAVSRWERHRLWVVDATLKPSERHIFSRWTFYVDEDSWQILMSEAYDHAGRLYRVSIFHPFQNYTEGDATNVAGDFTIYDLNRGSFLTQGARTNPGDYYTCSTKMPRLSEFTPQTMAAEGIR